MSQGFLASVREQIRSEFAAAYDEEAAVTSDASHLEATLTTLERKVWRIVEERLKQSHRNGQEGIGLPQPKPMSTQSAVVPTRKNPFRRAEFRSPYICAVCHEPGGDLRHSRRFNIHVHQECRGTCPKCRQPKDPEGFVCMKCEAEAVAAGLEVEIPNFDASSDLRQRAQNAAKSPVTGKSYPVRVHLRDDE